MRMVSRILVKAIVFPSGDHAGSKSPPGAEFRGIIPLPSALIMNSAEPFRMSKLRSRQGETMTIRLPSGDQEGWHAPSGKLVSFVLFSPFTSIIHIWGMPSLRVEQMRFDRLLRQWAWPQV